MELFEFLLLFQSLKVALFVIAFFIFALILILRSKASANRRDKSKDVIKTLSVFKYHALMESQQETDLECTICFCEYADDDIVTKLKCNDKHIFHKDCLTQWIATGKNTCPICRATIDDSVRM